MNAQRANQLLALDQPGGNALGGGDSNCAAHVSSQVRPCETSILTAVYPAPLALTRATGRGSVGRGSETPGLSNGGPNAAPAC